MQKNKQARSDKNNKNASTFTKIVDWLYLYLSDCDGMCNHCSCYLKEKCSRRKRQKFCS